MKHLCKSALNLIIFIQDDFVDNSSLSLLSPYWSIKDTIGINVVSRANYTLLLRMALIVLGDLYHSL